MLDYPDADNSRKIPPRKRHSIDARLHDQNIFEMPIVAIIGIHRVAVVKADHHCPRGGGVLGEPSRTGASLEQSFARHMPGPLCGTEEALFGYRSTAMSVVLRQGMAVPLVAECDRVVSLIGNKTRNEFAERKSEVAGRASQYPGADPAVDGFFSRKRKRTFAGWTG